MSKNHKYIDSLPTLLAAMFALILLIVSWSLKDIIKEKIGIENFSYYVTIIMLVAIAFMFLCACYLLMSLRKDCPSAISIKNLINEFQVATTYCRILEEMRKTGSTFLITTDQLLEFETKTNATEIIIFTPEVSLDMEDKFKLVIRENMARGVSYHYYVPNTQSIKSQMNGFMNWLKNNTPNYVDKLYINYLPEKVIVGGITLHVGQPPMGFINIPHRKYEKEYFVVMDDYFFNRNLQCIKALGEAFKKKRDS